MYITKLTMSQSQKPQFPPPQNTYYIMYPIDARVRPVKIFSCTQNTELLTGPWAECTALYCKVPVNIYLYFHLLISVCPKTIQVNMYGDKNI
jgi:hypothetical protein